MSRLDFHRPPWYRRIPRAREHERRMVKTAPAATDSPIEPTVRAMFSSSSEPPISRSSAMPITAAGSGGNRHAGLQSRYALAAPRTPSSPAPTKPREGELALVGLIRHVGPEFLFRFGRRHCNLDLTLSLSALRPPSCRQPGLGGLHHQAHLLGRSRAGLGQRFGDAASTSCSVAAAGR